MILLRIILVYYTLMVDPYYCSMSVVVDVGDVIDPYGVIHSRSTRQTIIAPRGSTVSDYPSLTE